MHRRIPRSDAPLHPSQHQQPLRHPLQASVAFDLLGDDSDDLLLAAANLLLREDASESFELPVIGVDFSSFQALLRAAATSTTAEGKPAPDRKTRATAKRPDAVDKDDADSTTRGRADRSTASSAVYSKNRRERNRISCRKTRLKRKTEQARADLVARKRAEHGEFLAELHLELTTRDAASCAKFAEQERMARHLVVRSVHLELVDPEYDASWCFAPPSRAAAAAVAQLELAAQWRAIAADFAVADLSILQIHDGGGDCVSCKWCVIATPEAQLQDGSSSHVSVAGVTQVRFRDRLVASVEMRVTNSSAFDIAI